MKCSVCGAGLANDLRGKEAHMKKYHAVTIEKPSYKPMDPKEKAAKVARMESRLASKVFLDDAGNFKGYGEIPTPQPIAFDDGSAIDDAKLDLGPLPKIYSPSLVKAVKALPPEGHKIEECVPECFDKKEAIVVPAKNDGWPVLEKGPINSQEDALKRLDNLIEFSDAVLAKMKQVFGQ